MAVLLYLLAAVTILLAFWIWKRQLIFQKLTKDGIPGPPPHWLFGHLLQVNYKEGRTDPVEVKDHWLKTFGNVVGYYDGVMPRILISDLDLLRHVFIKDFSTFPGRARTAKDSNMLLAMQGQKWKDVRKLMTPVFSSAKLKVMMPLIQECVEAFLEKCETFAEAREEFEVQYELQCLTLDAIDRCALALDLNCIKNPQNPIIDRIRRFFQTEQSLLFSLLFAFPELALPLEPLRTRSVFHKTQRFVIGHIFNVISRRKENPKTHSRQDALQMMMDANDPTSATKTKMTEREVVENAFLFVLAGYETTSNTLSYTIHLLSVYPEVQDTILKEVREVCGKGIPTYEDLGKLVYTEATLCEAMRMYPPIPSVMRKASEDIVYGDIKISKGMVVEAPIWSIHHDEHIYPEPHLFKPERFLPEMKQNLHPMAFLPFGAGPRICLGARFAMMEAKLTLATLVSKYVINPTSKTKDPLPTITRRVITNPRNGVWITLSKRSE